VNFDFIPWKLEIQQTNGASIADGTYSYAHGLGENILRQLESFIDKQALGKTFCGGVFGLNTASKTTIVSLFQFPQPRPEQLAQRRQHGPRVGRRAMST
jgi:hypothetical protein